MPHKFNFLKGDFKRMQRMLVPPVNDVRKAFQRTPCLCKSFPLLVNLDGWAKRCPKTCLPSSPWPPAGGPKYLVHSGPGEEATRSRVLPFLTPTACVGPCEFHPTRQGRDSRIVSLQFTGYPGLCTHALLCAKAIAAVLMETYVPNTTNAKFHFGTPDSQLLLFFLSCMHLFVTVVGVLEFTMHATGWL